MALKQPPEVDGIMPLSDVEKIDINSKLLEIKQSFVPDDFTLVCDTFYLVSTYNKQNQTAPINGDTAESLLN